MMGPGPGPGQVQEVVEENNNPVNPNQPQIFNAVNGQNLMYMGGTGDDTFIAGTGKDTFQGGGGADKFVFTLGEGSSNANLMIAAAMADGIQDFDRTDGDKIKILDTDGVTPLATPFGSGTLTSDNVSMEGFTIVKVTGTTEVVFGVEDNMIFTDADVTVI